MSRSESGPGSNSHGRFDRAAIACETTLTGKTFLRSICGQIAASTAGAQLGVGGRGSTPLSAPTLVPTTSSGRRSVSASARSMPICTAP